MPRGKLAMSSLETVCWLNGKFCCCFLSWLVIYKRDAVYVFLRQILTDG